MEIEDLNTTVTTANDPETSFAATTNSADEFQKEKAPLSNGNGIHGENHEEEKQEQQGGKEEEKEKMEEAQPQPENEKMEIENPNSSSFDAAATAPSSTTEASTGSASTHSSGKQPRSSSSSSSRQKKKRSESNPSSTTSPFFQAATANLPSTSSSSAIPVVKLPSTSSSSNLDKLKFLFSQGELLLPLFFSNSQESDLSKFVLPFFFGDSSSTSSQQHAQELKNSLKEFLAKHLVATLPKRILLVPAEEEEYSTAATTTSTATQGEASTVTDGSTAVATQQEKLREKLAEIVQQVVRSSDFDLLLEWQRLRQLAQFSDVEQQALEQLESSLSVSNAANSSTSATSSSSSAAAASSSKKSASKTQKEPWATLQGDLFTFDMRSTSLTIGRLETRKSVASHLLITAGNSGVANGNEDENTDFFDLKESIRALLSQEDKNAVAETEKADAEEILEGENKQQKQQESTAMVTEQPLQQEEKQQQQQEQQHEQQHEQQQEQQEQQKQETTTEKPSEQPQPQEAEETKKMTMDETPAQPEEQQNAMETTSNIETAPATPENNSNHQEQPNPTEQQQQQQAADSAVSSSTTTATTTASAAPSTVADISGASAVAHSRQRKSKYDQPKPTLNMTPKERFDRVNKISKRHCTIVWDEPKLRFFLLNYSKNGTFVDGVLYKDEVAVLSNGSQIRIGDELFHFRTKRAKLPGQQPQQ